MKRTLLACASLGVSLFSLTSLAQTLYWDGGATNGLWCDPVNWGNQAGTDPTYNQLPTAANTILFRDASPPGNVSFTCDAPVNRVRLTSATVPRTLEIGTNEVSDRTLTFGGTAAELIDQTASVAGRDLTFSGVPNTGGYKLKLVFNNTIRKPINVATVNSSVFVSSDVSGGMGFEKTGAGKLTLSGVNTIGGTNIISGGTLFVNSPGSLAATNPVIVSTNGTLGGSGTINGEVTVYAGGTNVSGTLSPGASVGTLTLNSNLTLAGNLYIELDKTLSPANDLISVAGTLTNAGTGTVTVVNLGPVAVVPGDSFQILNQPLPNGEALTVVSPAGVVWTNELAVNGSITVVSVPPMVPATNLTIAMAGPTSISLGGMGAANVPYRIHASTTVTAAMSNWSIIGTTNSDAGGVIQFLDTQATPAARYYRFGQMTP